MDTTHQVYESAGLCSRCNHAPVCMYRERRGPAQLCEMFDDYVEPTEPAVTKARPVYSDTAGESGNSGGLCMDCGNRTACAYWRPAGGVWHCEDYA